MDTEGHNQLNHTVLADFQITNPIPFLAKNPLLVFVSGIVDGELPTLGLHILGTRYVTMGLILGNDVYEKLLKFTRHWVESVELAFAQRQTPLIIRIGIRRLTSQPVRKTLTHEPEKNF